MGAADGLITISTSNNGIKSDGSIDTSGGTIEIQTDDDGLVCTERSINDAATVTENGESLSRGVKSFNYQYGHGRE